MIQVHRRIEMIRNLLLKLMALVFVFGVTMAPAMADSDKHDRDDHKSSKYDKKKNHDGDDEDYDNDDEQDHEDHNKHPEKY